MRYLILSDIHGNLEALERILTEQKTMRVDTIYSLGDIIGYGANPRECLQLMMRHAQCFICGNHEYAILSDEYKQGFNPFAYKAIEWTYNQLKKKDVDFIKTFSMVHVDNDFTLVHGSPQEPETFQYVDDSYDADTAFRSVTTRLCFIGHTHIPYLFTEGARRSSYFEEGKFVFDKKKRYIINVGSVGQPRDLDKRLSCALFDDDEYTVEIVRIAYDNKKAAGKITQAGLPQVLADRLS